MESAEDRIEYLYNKFVKKDDDMDIIPVVFKWISVQPDKRQWKPSQPILEPIDMYVRLDVPKEFAEISQEAKVILNPAGMRFCVDALETAMSDPAKPDTSDDEFETDKKKDNKEKDNLEEDDEWA